MSAHKDLTNRVNRLMNATNRGPRRVIVALHDSSVDAFWYDGKLGSREGLERLIEEGHHVSIRELFPGLLFEDGIDR